MFRPNAILGAVVNRLSKFKFNRQPQRIRRKEQLRSGLCSESASLKKIHKKVS